MLEESHEVIFAGNDRQQTFVAGLFPQITLRHLPGYDVTYGRNGLMAALMRQLPGLVRKVQREHEWLLRLVKEEQIDGIISDNRYGLWHPKVPAVILTHQAEIKTGFGQWADNLLRRIHYKYLHRFSACWIVDIAGVGNLGGSLSHPAILPQNACYIGWLSQLSEPQLLWKEAHLLILLSGPEPQRTILSDSLWQQVGHMNAPVVFVEGNPLATRDPIPAHIRHFTQIDATQLQALMEGAKRVVCRSGYSSLMDLVLLKKRVILIPTPGQTEQAYLAKSLMARRIFYAAVQKRFSLKEALAASARFPYYLPDTIDGHKQFMAVLDEWIKRL